jgi:hypothetical protein
MSVGSNVAAVVVMGKGVLVGNSAAGSVSAVQAVNSIKVVVHKKNKSKKRDMVYILSHLKMRQTVVLSCNHISRFC